MDESDQGADAAVGALIEVVLPRHPKDIWQARNRVTDRTSAGI